MKKMLFVVAAFSFVLSAGSVNAFMHDKLIKQMEGIAKQLDQNQQGKKNSNLAVCPGSPTSDGRQVRNWKNCKGTFIDNKGTTVFGKWENSRLQGEVIITNSQGDVGEGNYKDSKLIGKVKIIKLGSKNKNKKKIKSTKKSRISISGGDVNRCLTAYKRSDFATALHECKPLAQQGDVRAQYNLGEMYDKGRGVRQDNKTAVKWYTLAAKQGFARAQYNLGLMYRNGQGVPKDYKTAVKWYTLAAKQEFARAQFYLDDLKEQIAKETEREKKRKAAEKKAEKRAAARELAAKKAEKRAAARELAARELAARELAAKKAAAEERDRKEEEKLKTARGKWGIKFGMTINQVAKLSPNCKVKEGLDGYNNITKNLRCSTHILGKERYIRLNEKTVNSLLKARNVRVENISLDLGKVTDAMRKKLHRILSKKYKVNHLVTPLEREEFNNKIRSSVSNIYDNGRIVVRIARSNHFNWDGRTGGWTVENYMFLFYHDDQSATKIMKLLQRSKKDDDL